MFVTVRWKTREKCNIDDILLKYWQNKKTYKIFHERHRYKQKNVRIPCARKYMYRIFTDRWIGRRVQLNGQTKHHLITFFGDILKIDFIQIGRIILTKDKFIFELIASKC